MSEHAGAMARAFHGAAGLALALACLLAGNAQARGVVVVAGGVDPTAAVITGCASTTLLLPAGGSGPADCTAVYAREEARWGASPANRVDTINRLVSQTQELYASSRLHWAQPFSDSGQVAAAQAGEPLYVATGLTDFVEHAAAVDGSLGNSLFTLNALSTPAFSTGDGPLRITQSWDLALQLNQAVSGPFVLDVSGGTVYGDAGVNRPWRISYLFEGSGFAAGSVLTVVLPALDWTVALSSPVMGADGNAITSVHAGTLAVEHVALYLDPVAVPVPEPATALLWAGGAALLGWVRRRRG